MAALTWRNVDAPNFGASLQGIGLFSNLLGNATNALSTGLQGLEDRQADSANRQLALNASKLIDANSLNTGLQSGSVLAGVDPNLVSPEALAALSNRAGNMGQQDIARMNSQLSAARLLADTNRQGLLDSRDKDTAALTLDIMQGAYNAGDARDLVAQAVARGVDPRIALAAASNVEPKFGGMYGSLGSLASDSDLTQGNQTGPTLSDRLFDSMVITESSGRQFDDKGNTLLGPVTKSGDRAVGIAQVMPKTAPEAAALAGLAWDEKRYKEDPEYNKAIGKAYFNKQLADFGSPEKAMAAYNAGPGATRSAIRQANAVGKPDSWLSYLPTETQNYIPTTLKRLQAGATTDLIDWNANRNVVAGSSVNAWDEAVKDNSTFADVKKRSKDTIGDVPNRELNDAYAYLQEKDPGMTPAIAEKIIAGSIRNTSALWNMSPWTATETIDMDKLEAGVNAWKEGGILDNQTTRRALDISREQVNRAETVLTDLRRQQAQLRNRGLGTAQARNRDSDLSQQIEYAEQSLQSARTAAGELVQPRPQPLETKPQVPAQTMKETPRYTWGDFPY